jgi:hypothetical protein
LRLKDLLGPATRAEKKKKKKHGGYRGISLIRNTHPHRITIDPQA